MTKDCAFEDLVSRIDSLQHSAQIFKYCLICKIFNRLLFQRQLNVKLQRDKFSESDSSTGSVIHMCRSNLHSILSLRIRENLANP